MKDFLSVNSNLQGTCIPFEKSRFTLSPVMSIWEKRILLSRIFLFSLIIWNNFYCPYTFEVFLIFCCTVLGYCRKYPELPYGRHWIGYLKISGFPRMTVAVFAGSQTLLILNLGEFQNFAILSMVFVEFRSKFTKFGGNLWISSHTQ